jgi:hypothetical protein
MKHHQISSPLAWLYNDNKKKIMISSNPAHIVNKHFLSIQPASKLVRKIGCINLHYTVPKIRPDINSDLFHIHH